MINFLRHLFLFLNIIRSIPHLVLLYTHKNRKIIRKDIIRWLKIMEQYYDLPVKIIYRNLSIGFVYLLVFYPEYRNLFYNRVGDYWYFLNIFFPRMRTLIVGTKDLGEGLFIQHGFATAIGAISMGKNCLVNQQVTIAGNVRIKDNVRIHSGAVIIGNLTIGNNCVIGANATVFKDVPDNCSVFPAFPKVMQWKPINNPSGDVNANLDLE